MDVNKDSSLKAKAWTFKAKARTKDWRFKAKARTKDLTFKAKARTKDSMFKAKARTKDSDFVLKDNQGPRPRTTSLKTYDILFFLAQCWVAFL